MKLHPPQTRLKKILLELIWLLPGLIFYGLFRLAFLWPEFTETQYSRGVFRAISQALSALFGWIPFSLGEFLLYAFVLFVVIHVLLMLVHAILAKKLWWYVLLRRVIALLGVALSRVPADIHSGAWLTTAAAPAAASAGDASTDGE